MRIEFKVNSQQVSHLVSFFINLILLNFIEIKNPEFDIRVRKLG